MIATIIFPYKEEETFFFFPITEPEKVPVIKMLPDVFHNFLNLFFLGAFDDIVST